MTHQRTVTEGIKPTTKSVMSVQSMRSCIDACTETTEICESMVNQCLSKGGDHSSPEHIKALLDCAEICSLSAKWMTRESSLHTESCALCEKVCLACAESCAQFSDDARCEEACRKCAESCHEMARQH